MRIEAKRASPDNIQCNSLARLLMFSLTERSLNLVFVYAASLAWQGNPKDFGPFRGRALCHCP